jgi:protein involved in ribonucleotide reduction
MLKRYPSEGKLLKVYWDDVTGHVNSYVKRAKPAPATSIGYLHKEYEDYIVLASSYFTETLKDGGEVEGDFTALPKGMITKIEVL